MTKFFKSIALLVMLLIFPILLVGCKPWTIVKNEDIKNEEAIDIYFASDDFDAESYVKDLWDSSLFDYFNDKKVDASVLVEELQNDEQKAGDAYGIGTNDTGSSWNFIVEGKGKVLEVNTESRAGIMLVDLEPYDNETDLTFQIGPVIKGSSTRDCLDFIKLDDFSNQVQFSTLSKEFNNLIVSDVLANVDLENIEDKEINFLGSFTFNGVGNYLVSPIQLEIVEES